MSSTISLEDAHRILGDVRPDQCFWVNNGPILRNLHEVFSAIPYIKDEAFSHHVNGSKNDFSNWVRDVLKDPKLADALSGAKTREKMVAEIGKRIKFLERAIEKASSQN